MGIAKEIVRSKMMGGGGGGGASLQAKSVSVTANGAQTISPDTGYDGMSSVGLTVDVPTGGNTPIAGFVPSEWDKIGYVKNGTWYGESIPACMFANISNGSLLFGTWKLTDISFADAVTTFNKNTFYECTTLALTSLPNTIKTIGSGSFHHCESLTITHIPATVTYLGDAFQYCTGLTSITFGSIPSLHMSASPFTGCTNLTTINVPWAYGAVANAPWGATNATINYNYTGG